jgi:hypothetical protein
MTNNTIRPTTPTTVAVVPSQASPRERPSSPKPTSENPLSSGRNTGNGPMAQRRSLPDLPGNVIQKIMGHLAPDQPSRIALSETGPPMAAHAAIHNAEQESDFKAADQAVRQLPQGQRGEATVALLNRFTEHVHNRCRLEVGGELQPLGDDVFRVSDTMYKAMAELPAGEGDSQTLSRMSKTMLSAHDSIVKHTLLYPASESQRLDDAHGHIAVQVKNMTDMLRGRRLVTDQAAMNGLLDDCMGPKGTVFSAVNAFSELPQHALDLPTTPEGNAQTVKMMTKMAKLAVKDAGLLGLKSEPSWAEFLRLDRIAAVLVRKEIVVAKKGEEIAFDQYPELKDALDKLKEKGREMTAA